MSDDPQPARGLVAELKRRNVFRVAAFYIVISWLSLQVADIVFPALGLPPWSVTLVLALLALGFPIAVLFAWVFELTPEGIKREREVDRSQSISHATGQKLNVLIIGVLVAAVIVLLVDKFLLRSPAVSAVEIERTIAVLPFVNMNGDAETAVFSDGLAETLLHMLAQIDDLHVAARTSSFQFRDQSGDVGAIAAQLNVRNLLEGSVQRWGDQISVTAQLIDANSGYHLWSGNYRRTDLSNVFAIQEDIASQVVSKLQLTLLGSPSTLDEGGTDNVKAYEAYLQGRLAQANNSFESLPVAEGFYKAAIELDPDYGRAYLELAETYLDMGDVGVLDIIEALTKARPILNEARNLLGESPQVLAVAGRFEADNMFSAGEPAQTAAEAAFLAALEADPDNVKALTNYSAFLQATLQRPAEAAQYAARGLRYDPRSERLLSVYGSTLRRLGRTDEALLQFAKLREYYPQSPAGYYQAAFASSEAGRFADAVRWARAAAKVDPADHEIPVLVARFLIDVNYAAAAMPWLDRSLGIDADSNSARAGLLDLYLVSGQREKGLTLARDMLEKDVPARQGARWISLWYLLDEAFRIDDYSEFMRFMRQFYPTLFASPVTLDATNDGYASLLFRGYYAMGETDKADELAQRLLRLFAEQARQDSDANIDDEILVYGTLGRTDEALDRLERLVRDKKLVAFWTYDYEPGLQALRDTERYKSLRQRAGAYLDEQREQVQANGDHLVP